MSRRTPRLALLLDFDSTITKSDTTPIIGTKCLAKARELARPGLADSQVPKSMEFYGKIYMQDYRAWKDAQSESLEACSTVEEVVEHPYASRSVEEKSFSRVRDAVLGVSDQTRELERNRSHRNEFMMELGIQAVQSGELEIRDRDSLRRLINHAEEEGEFWGVISLSWSRRFILGALVEAGLVETKRAEDMVERIKCNELLAPIAFDEENRPKIVCTAQDKLAAMNDLLSSSIPPDRKDETIVVYVGDSTTDVGCLAAATMGFHMTDNPGVEVPAIQTVKRLGIESKTVDEIMASPTLLGHIIDEHRAGRGFHAIVEVTSFDQIWAWVSKHFSSSA